MKIWNFLGRLTDVSTSDPDEKRRARLLNIILLGVAGISLILLLALLLFGGQAWSTTAPLMIKIVIVLLGATVIYLINRKSAKLASYIFLSFMTILFSFIDKPVEVSSGRSLFTFTLTIVMASILISPASSFTFAGLSSVIISILATNINRIPNVPAMGGFFLLAFVSWLSARSLEQALRDLRNINANLDRLVDQKTEELAGALSRELVLAGRNQAILNSIADGVIVFDATNTAILANPALSRLTETPMHNLLGNRFTDIINTDRLSPTNRGTMLGLIENPDKTVPGFRVEWGKKTLSTSIARVQDATGDNIGTVAVFRDVSKEAELEKMKDTFVAIVSHELRTPLNAIMGHAEMLKEAVYGTLNEKQLSITERILVNGKRLLGMVGDLLDEAQIRAGKLSIKPQVFRTITLLETLHTTMDKIAQDRGLYLTNELDPEIPERLKGDPQRLQQVLINLVNNAVKFTEDGGVCVRILRSGQSHWKMEVTDTGSGIAAEEVPYIFETFRQVHNVTTRQHGGFGLGLSIVKQLVELMGGEITVQSQQGVGSTFTVTLPLESGW